MRDFNEEFMKPVEKIVRPINASIANKMRMREELYGHIELIFQEENQRTEEEVFALEKSIQRLGKPDKLRGELQGTVSKREQFMTRYNSLFNRQQGESRLRFSLRMGIGMGLLEAVAYGLAILVCSIVIPDKSVVQIAPLLMVISLLMGWNTFLGVYLSQSFVELESYSRKSKSNLAWSGFFFGISIGLSEIIMWLSIPGEFAKMNVTIPQMVFPTLAGWGMFCLVVWLIKLEKDQTAPWELLQLDN